MSASAFVDAFFGLVAPGPLLFVGALVDPLVSLCSSGSCWLVLGLETGGACDGPPALVVGAAGADPCGLLPVALEGQPWALFSLSIVGSLRMVHSLLPSSDDDCCGCVALLSGTNLPWTFLFVMDSSGLYETSPLGLWWGLIEVCWFAVWLWSPSLLRCRCRSSTFYITVSRCLRIVHIKGNGADFT